MACYPGCGCETVNEEPPHWSISALLTIVFLAIILLPGLMLVLECN